MKAVLNERKCPAQAKIVRRYPPAPEGAITYIVANGAPLGGRIVFDETRCTGSGTCGRGLLRPRD